MLPETLFVDHSKAVDDFPISSYVYWEWLVVESVTQRKVGLCYVLYTIGILTFPVQYTV